MAYQYLAPILLMTIASSCSTYQRPEAFEAKMNRFSAKTNSQNIVPKIYPQPLLLQGRAPASIAPLKKVKPLNYSNKKLYFKGLYTQYQSLRNFASASTPIVKSCPHFHSSIVESKESGKVVEFITPKGAELEKIASLYIEAKNNPGLFPELHLPVQKLSNEDTIFSNIKNDKKTDQIPYQVQSAINIHLEKTYGELQELCQSGSSNNYFIFQNMTSLQKSQKLKRGEKALNSFFKTTLLSNMAIITSLESWTDTKMSPKVIQLNIEIMKRLKGLWFQDYLSQIISKRKKLTTYSNKGAHD